MLKMWPTKIFLKIIVPIFQPMVLYYILECQTPLACLVYCTLQNVWAICRLHSMLHAAMAVSISHAVVCDTMFMFTDLPLRSGWRSCCLAPQYLALTGLLTSQGGQFLCNVVTMSLTILLGLWRPITSLLLLIQGFPEHLLLLLHVFGQCSLHGAQHVCAVMSRCAM